MDQNKRYLPHLSNNVVSSAYGANLCMYVIALEGWRRGMTVKFLKGNRILYSLKSDIREHKFNKSRGDKVPKDAVKLCINKDLTKIELEKSRIPVPQGKRFNYTGDNAKDLIDYAFNIGFPVVLKPTKGSLGRGVISNIKNENMLKEAIQHVCQKLNEKDIIIEKHITGDDFRLYVVGNQVVGAVKRVPANVVGDGGSTIQELIVNKNLQRKKNPYLSKGLIKIDEELLGYIQKEGYNLNSILNDGEKVFLMAKANASAGADTVDATDELPEKIKQTAIDAAQAMPGLVHCGIDMIIDQTEDNLNHGTIIEINSRAELGIHLFPSKGKARDVPAAILDYYFPETIVAKEDLRKITSYFDFRKVESIFRNELIKEVVLKHAPKIEGIKRRIVVSGNIQGESFKKWIEKQSKKLKLNGYIRDLKSGNTLIIIQGRKKNVEELLEQCRTATGVYDVDRLH